MISAPSVTTLIAIYGAVLSTIAILRQVMGDKIKVNLKVQKGMEIVGDPLYQGLTLTILTVTNMGKRPVTITTFGAIRLHPHKNFVAIDSRPKLPCEITEGKYITSFWDQEGIDFSTIDYSVASDSRGKSYKAQEASRFKHLKSVLQQKRASRKKKKVSDQTSSL